MTLRNRPMPAPPVGTSDQVRELDRIAVEEYGIDGLILMENAGRQCALAAAEMLGGAEGKAVTVLCGKGNNGGDGFVVTRHLTNWGADVTVILLAAVQDVLAAANESSANLRIILNMDVPVLEAREPQDVERVLGGRPRTDLLVDGLLGTGLRGTVREPFRTAIGAINASRLPVLAIDVPSGLDCDTGEPLGTAVRADRTVTFACNKVGFTRPPARQYTGRVEVAEISIPRAELERLLAPSSQAGQ